MIVSSYIDFLQKYNIQLVNSAQCFDKDRGECLSVPEANTNFIVDQPLQNIRSPISSVLLHWQSTHTTQTNTIIAAYLLMFCKVDDYRQALAARSNILIKRSLFPSYCTFPHAASLETHAHDPRLHYPSMLNAHTL